MNKSSYINEDIRIKMRKWKVTQHSDTQILCGKTPDKMKIFISSYPPTSSYVSFDWYANLLQNA